MAGISSLGIGSGIDVKSLVDQLVAAERKPVQNRLDRKEARYQAELSAFGALKGALSEFQTKVESLSDADAFRVMTATSGNSDAVAVSAGATAEPGAYDIAVNALASSQALASGAFASADTSVGAGGTLTFRFGTVTTDGSGAVTDFSQNAGRAVQTVDIAPDATSLTAIRDAVNDADIGVQASVINDGSGERLVFNAADSGADNGFVVEVADDDGNDTDGAGLSQLAFNSGAANLERTRAGADAELVVNGLTVTRASNEITDLIDGVTFNLKDTTSAATQISVEQDVASVTQTIKGFVDAYNSLQDTIDQLSGYDPETKKSGTLQGDAAVRTIANSLRRLVTRRLDVLEGRDVRALTDLGITSNRDGKLEIDSAKLDDALADNFDEVGALFGTTGLVDGAGFRYESSRSATSAGDYGVDVTQLAQQATITSTVDLSPSASTPFTVNADNDELTLTVDGVTSGTISLTQGDYTSGAALAAEFQARINGDSNFEDEGITVEVGYSGNRLTITSSRYGSESDVAVSSVDNTTSASLGLDTSLSDTGVDVAGTVGGVQAEGFGRYLTAENGAAEGLKVEVTGSQTGSLGSVTFSRGITNALSEALDSYLGSDGVLTSTTKSLNNRIDDIGDDRQRLQDRLARIEDRYLAQFNAMDATVARLNQTSSFLTNQLSGLENLAKSGGGTK
jgi:flagellar hook-associated protein 2